MSIYTITIRAEDSDSETLIRVDSDGPTPRIVELAVRAGGEGGISAPELPAFDVKMLLRALLSPGEQPSSGRQRVRRTEVVAKNAAGATTTPSKRTVRPALSRGAGAAASRRSSSDSDKLDVPSSRVYRRMPDDVVEVYNRTGTVTAMAQHYGVPRHTAQGWIGRLRRQGGLSISDAATT